MQADHQHSPLFASWLETWFNQLPHAPAALWFTTGQTSSASLKLWANSNYYRKEEEIPYRTGILKVVFINLISFFILSEKVTISLLLWVRKISNSPDHCLTVSTGLKAFAVWLCLGLSGSWDSAIAPTMHLTHASAATAQGLFQIWLPHAQGSLIPVSQKHWFWEQVLNGQRGHLFEDSLLALGLIKLHGPSLWVCYLL